jgi:PAS domain-containing protein
MSILFLEKLLSDLNLRIENAPDLSSWKKFNADLDKMLSEFQLKLDQYKKEIDLGSLEVLRLAELFQQKEQLLKSIFNASSDMIMTFDSRGQLIEYNHTTPETLGVSAKELSGKNYSEFF